MERRSSVFPFRSPVASALLGVLLANWPLPCLTPGPGDDADGGEVPAIYRPVATDFQPEYRHDAPNGRVQTWEQYWGWVNSYYRGNLVSNGWIKETELSLARVSNPAIRGELLQEMNAAGRLVSREWAKDGSVRKIDTNDLIAWGNRLNAARRDEKGDGAALLAIARAIHIEAKLKITGKPGSPRTPPRSA